MAKRAKASAKKRVKPIPAGYRSVTPYLTVRDGARAIDFYKDALGAVEKVRMIGPDGRSVMHAELKIGDSIVMLSDEFPGMSTCRSPQSLGGTTVSLFLYVRDVDAAFKRASNSGCKVLMELTDMFWGDRFGKVTDPFGHVWGLATHKEDLSPDEVKKRGAAAMAAMGKPHP